jgi:hypothetical protein
MLLDAHGWEPSPEGPNHLLDPDPAVTAFPTPHATLPTVGSVDVSR